jgi:peptide deformylase
MLIKLAETLNKYVTLVDCYSVNAPQLGLQVRAFMLNTGLFCYKPKIVLFGSTRIAMDEYSSQSKESVLISRPATIVAAYTNYKNERVLRDLDGVEARYYQHEIDNLMGISWKTRATQTALINAKKRVLH